MQYQELQKGQALRAQAKAYKSQDTARAEGAGLDTASAYEAHVGPTTKMLLTATGTVHDHKEVDIMLLD